MDTKTGETVPMAGFPGEKSTIWSDFSYRTDCQYSLFIYGEFFMQA